MKLPALLLLPPLLACKGGDAEDTAVEEEAPGSIQLSTSTLDFGEATIFEEQTLELEVKNVGAGPLELYDLQLSDDALRAHWRIDGTTHGVISAQSSATFAIHLDAQAVVDPSVTLRLLSDDPDRPTVEVALTADVDGIPRVEVNPEVLDFGEVPLGDSAVEYLYLGNLGSGDLHLESIAVEGRAGEAFTLDVSPEGATLAPGATDGLVAIRFTPQILGSDLDSLLIGTDDPETPLVAVLMTGDGLD